MQFKCIDRAIPIIITIFYKPCNFIENYRKFDFKNNNQAIGDSKKTRVCSCFCQLWISVSHLTNEYVAPTLKHFHCADSCIVHGAAKDKLILRKPHTEMHSYVGQSVN